MIRVALDFVQTHRRHFLAAGLLLIVLQLSGCEAVSKYDWGGFVDALDNLIQTFPAIYKLLTAFSFVAGMAFVLKGVFMLKTYGESRTMMSSNASLKGPLISIGIGTLLIFFSATFDTLIATIWGSAGVMSYADPGSTNQLARITYVMVEIIRLLGLIAFIRGWMILSGLSSQSHPPGLVGKGLTHIIGGVLALNIVGVAATIGVTIGVTVI